MWKLAAVLLLLALVAFSFFPSDDKLATIKGKRVLITGASKGIGEQLAYQFAKYGASTVVTARRQHVLEKVVKKCQSIGSPDATHTAISSDMLDLNTIPTFIDKSVKQLGGLDIVLLNHVAVNQAAFFDGSKENRETVYHIIDLDFKSYIEIAGAALTHLTKSEGSIVAVNSVAGIVPNPMQAAYSAAKFGLNGFFHSLRSQFIMEERNVSVTTCILGAIDTESLQSNWKKGNLTRLQKYVIPVSAEDTAFAILRATARRDDVMYYPFSSHVYTYVCRFVPSFCDYTTRELYKHN